MPPTTTSTYLPGSEPIGLMGRVGERFALGAEFGFVEPSDERPSPLRPFGMRFLRELPTDLRFDVTRISYCPDRQLALYEGMPLRAAKHTSGKTQIKIDSDGSGGGGTDVQTDIRDD